MTDKIFRGGIPTRPDVEALQKAFAARKPGDMITYQEASGVIHEPIGSSRLRGVLAAYRRAIFRNAGLQLVAEPGVGYRIMTADQAVDESIRGMTRVSKAAHRVTIRTDAIDTTQISTQQGRDKHALLRRHAHAIETATRDAALAVAGREPPRPVASTYKPSYAHTSAITPPPTQSSDADCPPDQA